MELNMQGTLIMLGSVSGAFTLFVFCIYKVIQSEKNE
jgi:hypothetical protein